MKTLSKVAITTMTLLGFAGAGLADNKQNPPAEMPMAKPAKELVEMTKNMAGTWKCTGKAYVMGNAIDMTGKMTSKAEMDGMWVHDIFDAKMGKASFHFDSFTTFDEKTKKWHRVMVENGGGYSTGTSDGVKDNKIDFELAVHGTQGNSTFRDHIDASDVKKGVKSWGEMSMDGKKWDKVYEQTCTK
jgi:hypothetical protein